MVASFSMNNIGENKGVPEFNSLEELVRYRLGEGFEIVDVLRYEGDAGKALYYWVKVEGSGVVMMQWGIVAGGSVSLSMEAVVQDRFETLFDDSNVKMVGDDELKGELRERALAAAGRPSKEVMDEMRVKVSDDLREAGVIEEEPGDLDRPVVSKDGALPFDMEGLLSKVWGL